MKNNYDVLIVTIGDSLSSSYVKSLTETLQKLSSRGITYKWLNGYGSLEHNARESAITGNGLQLNPTDKGPLGDTCTYKKIFWIGSNISWNFSDFLKLYESEEQIISGMYLLDNKTSNVTRLSDNCVYTKDQILKLKHKTKIASAKFGFLAVKYGVYEKIGRPWHNVFPPYETEEDTWCFKTKNVGIDVYLEPTVFVSNLIMKEVTWK